MRSAIFTLCLLPMLGVAPAASSAQERPGPPDAAITTATRRAVLDSLAARIEGSYVHPDVGDDVVRALRRHAGRGDYDRITSARAFADTLNDHMFAVAHDLHLRVTYDPGQQVMMACGGGGAGERGDMERMRAMARQHNFGFEKVQRLAGNVGYLDLRTFDPPGLGAGDVAAAALGFLGNADALIIDIRRNGGGTAAMVELMITYLLEPGQRAHLFDMRTRTPEGVELTQSWTLPYAPGPRFGGKGIFILTSPFTASAAESFAYAAQAGDLATIVGEKTAGAGNHGSGFAELPGDFKAFVATGTVTNPVTKAGWEGVGVKPDVAVPAGEALRAAHVRALESLLGKAATEEDRTRLQAALQLAEKTALDPVEPPQGMRIIMR